MSQVYVRSTSPDTWHNVKSQCENDFDEAGKLATFDDGDDITDIHEICVDANDVDDVGGCYLGLLLWIALL